MNYISGAVAITLGHEIPLRASDHVRLFVGPVIGPFNRFMVPTFCRTCGIVKEFICSIF